MPIPLRSDFDASQLRALARKTKDGPQVRRLPASAAIYEGASRSEAARIGGVTLQIVRDWVVRFKDQGPGIPAAHRRQVFEKFHRVDASLTARQQGSGLGLSIARQLAEGLGGSLGFCPNAGGGACFEHPALDGAFKIQ